LIEALYLLEKKGLKIISSGKYIEKDELQDYAMKTIPRFRELYLVYRDLRERGFVVRRGLKFGCDYLAYRFGPGIDHAPFGIEVLRKDDNYEPIILVRMGRLLHSVRKKLILAIVDGEKINYILLTWWKP